VRAFSPWRITTMPPTWSPRPSRSRAAAVFGTQLDAARHPSGARAPRLSDLDHDLLEILERMGVPAPADMTPCRRTPTGGRHSCWTTDASSRHPGAGLYAARRFGPRLSGMLTKPRWMRLRQRRDRLDGVAAASSPGTSAAGRGSGCPSDPRAHTGRPNPPPRHRAPARFSRPLGGEPGSWRGIRARASAPVDVRSSLKIHVDVRETRSRRNRGSPDVRRAQQSQMIGYVTCLQ